LKKYLTWKLGISSKVFATKVTSAKMVQGSAMKSFSNVVATSLAQILVTSGFCINLTTANGLIGKN
jgi:hypothetical protein